MRETVHVSFGVEEFLTAAELVFGAREETLLLDEALTDYYDWAGEGGWRLVSVFGHSPLPRSGQLEMGFRGPTEWHVVWRGHDTRWAPDLVEAVGVRSCGCSAEKVVGIVKELCGLYGWTTDVYGGGEGLPLDRSIFFARPDGFVLTAPMIAEVIAAVGSAEAALSHLRDGAPIPWPRKAVFLHERGPR